MELKDLIKQEGNEKDFEYKGYICHIRRVGVPYSGHLCGYIEIPAGHKLCGVGYDDIESYYNYDLPAHGGLTFSGTVDENYWIGFDCAHTGDLCPMYDSKYSSPHDIYKDMNYVEKKYQTNY